MTELLEIGAKHKGTSFIEVYQDCNVFNHQTWFYATQKDSKLDNTIMLEDGKPMVYGADRDKGLRRFQDKVEVVKLGDGVTEDDLLVHDVTNIEQAFLLSQMFAPEFPESMGVLYVDKEKQTYDEMMYNQIEDVIAKNEGKTLQTLVTGNNTWTVE